MEAVMFILYDAFSRESYDEAQRHTMLTGAPGMYTHPEFKGVAWYTVWADLRRADAFVWTSL